MTKLITFKTYQPCCLPSKNIEVKTSHIDYKSIQPGEQVFLLGKPNQTKRSFIKCLHIQSMQILEAFMSEEDIK
jgi:hypothetical protein